MMGAPERPVESGSACSGQENPLGSIDNRRHPRLDCMVPVFVRILIAEETFTPFSFAGRSCNISASGILVEIEGLNEERYRMVIRRERLVRVHMSIPEAGGEVIFLGKGVWYDFRYTKRGSSCLIGIAFEPLGEGERRALNVLLQRLQVKVLVVTDDPASRQELERSLKMEGHKVFLAGDGIEAAKTIRLHYPQIVIADRTLPRLDGLRLCQDVKSDPRLRSVYFILMTETIGETEKYSAAEVQADELLKKPVDRTGLMERLRVAVGVVEYQKSLEAMAIKDGLTGLSNRRAFDAALVRETTRARRHKTPLTLAVIDVNRFKEINDLWGHDQGDVVLRLIADIITEVLGYQDSAFRIGGDEFALLLPEPGGKARQVVERIQNRLGTRDDGKPTDPSHPTISIGLAECDCKETADELFRRADAEMYKVKRSGNAGRGNEGADGTGG